MSSESTSSLPASLRKLILSTTHLSGDPVSGLVERVQEALSSALFPGESVELVGSGERGVVLSQAKPSATTSPGSDKENSAQPPPSYSVQLDGSKKRLTLSARELKRTNQPEAEDIEDFICSAAHRVDKAGKAHWQIKPAFAAQMDDAKPSNGTNGNGFLHVETAKTSMEDANEAVTSNMKSPLASPQSAASPTRPSLNTSGFGPLKTPAPPSSSSSEESEDDDAPSPPSNRLSGGFAPSAVKAKKAQADAAKKRALEAKERKRQEEKEAKEAAKEAARLAKEAARKEKQHKKTLNDYFQGKSDKMPAVSTGDAITLSSDEDDVPLANVKDSRASDATYQPSSTSGSSAAFDAAKRAEAIAKLKAKSPGLKKKLSGMDPSDRAKEQKKLEARLKQLSSSPKKSSVIDLLRGSSTSSGAKKAPSSPKKALTPAEMQRLRVQATVKKLSKTWTKDGAKSATVSNLVNITAKILTRAQIEGQVEPDELRDRCLRAHEALEEKKKMKNMTAEEKEAYLKERRKEKIREANQKRKRAMEKARQRFEDTKIPDLEPLPTLKPVLLPPTLPNEAFGDVVAVSEFGKAYAGLLSSEKSWNVEARELAKAVASAGQGWSSVAKVLVPMLQTLLQDEVAAEYRHLGLRLAQLTVSEANASELLRLCLRKRDDPDSKEAPAKVNGKATNGDGGDSPPKEEDGDEMEELKLEDEEEKMEEEEVKVEETGDVDEALVAALEKKELWELDPSEILLLLNAVLLRLLDSYSVNEYQANIHAELADVTKEKADWAREVAEIEAKLSPLKELPPLKPEFPREDEAAEDSDGPRDLTETIASRRAQAREEKIRREEREKLEKKHNQRAREAEKRTAKWDQIERKFQDTLRASKTTTRLAPLGLDRFHRRYWLTSQPSPALFVETAGWAKLPAHLEKVQSKSSLVKEAEAVKDEEEAGKTEGSDDEVPLGAIAKQAALEEETVPEASEAARWLEVETADQLDALLASLAEKGQREGDLLVNLRANEKAIRKILAKPVIKLDTSQSNEGEEKEAKEEDVPMETGSDGPEASVTLLEALRLDLIGLVKRLSEGGLANFEEDPGRLLDTIDAAPGREELKPLLIAAFKAVHSKFFKGFMSESYWGGRGEEEDEEDKDESERSKYGGRVWRWMEAVSGAATTSALHVAMDMLEASIDWSRSAENARCRQCKRKGNDEALLLCDDCNAAFHLHCLRPPLSRVPRGEWFCPSCKPKRQAKLRASQDEEESDEEEEEEETSNRRSNTRRPNGPKAKKAKTAPAKPNSDLYSDEGSEVDIRSEGEKEEEEEESSDEEIVVRRPSRNAKDKAKAAIKEQETPEGGSGRSRRRSPTPQPPNPLEGELQRRLDVLLKSRLTSAIDSLPNTSGAASSTRSRPSNSKPHCDLNSIKERLVSYKSLEAFYDDVESAVQAGLLHWAQQRRKVSALEELSALVAKERSQLEDDE